jgi:hypothetical protein
MAIWSSTMAAPLCILTSNAQGFPLGETGTLVHCQAHFYMLIGYLDILLYEVAFQAFA